MHLVTFFQATQDRDGRFNARLRDIDWLEAAFQGGVFLDVLAIFVQSGRADGAQLAAGELRFHNVRRIGRPFGCPGADQRVQFINEQNDLAFAGNDFLEERLEPILKFTAILRAGDHRAEVHCHKPLVL